MQSNPIYLDHKVYVGQYSKEFSLKTTKASSEDQLTDMHKWRLERMSKTFMARGGWSNFANGLNSRHFSIQIEIGNTSRNGKQGIFSGKEKRNRGCFKGYLHGVQVWP